MLSLVFPTRRFNITSAVMIVFLSKNGVHTVATLECYYWHLPFILTLLVSIRATFSGIWTIPITQILLAIHFYNFPATNKRKKIKLILALLIWIVSMLFFCSTPALLIWIVSISKTCGYWIKWKNNNNILPFTMLATQNMRTHKKDSWNNTLHDLRNW